MKPREVSPHSSIWIELAYYKVTGKKAEMEPMKSLQEGASTPLVAALDPSIAGK